MNIQIFFENCEYISVDGPDLIEVTFVETWWIMAFNE